MRRGLLIAYLCFAICVCGAWQQSGLPVMGSTWQGASAASTFSVDLTGQNGSIGATNVTGLSSLSAAGFYCATAFEVVTTAATTTSTLPQINFIFTDSDTSTVETQNIANSTGAQAAQAAGTVNGTYNTSLTGANSMCGYAQSGTAIQYSTTGYASTGGTAMVYAFHMRVFGPISAGAVDTTGLTGTISPTNVPGLSSISGNGFYCARVYEVITTSVATTTELPNLNILYTDADTSVSENTSINGAVNGSPSAVGTTNGVYGPPTIHGFCFYAQSGTAIQYSTSNYASTPAGMTYAFHLRVVGPITTNPVDVTGLAASVSATNVPGLSSLGASGYYCALSYAVITTVAGTSSSIPYLQTVYTPADAGSAVTDWVASSSGANTLGFAIGTYNSAPVTSSFCFYAKSGTAIQYSTNSYASNPAATMTYAIHYRIVGPTQF